MELLLKHKKGQVSMLQGFFLTMMMIVIFAGLTFIVAEKFLDASYKTTPGSAVNETLTAVNRTVVDFAVSERDENCGAVTDVRNVTGGIVIGAGNYTQWNCGLNFTSQIAGDIKLYGGHNWNVSYTYNYEADTIGSNSTSSLSEDLYNYGIGFLGIVILVVMVYLIISIVTGRKSGAM